MGTPYVDIIASSNAVDFRDAMGTPSHVDSLLTSKWAEIAQISLVEGGFTFTSTEFPSFEMGQFYSKLAPLPAGCLGVDLSMCPLEVPQVNALLKSLDDNGRWGGYCNINGLPAPPSIYSDASEPYTNGVAIVANLRSKNWTVQHTDVMSPADANFVQVPDDGSTVADGAQMEYFRGVGVTYNATPSATGDKLFARFEGVDMLLGPWNNGRIWNECLISGYYAMTTYMGKVYVLYG